MRIFCVGVSGYIDGSLVFCVADGWPQCNWLMNAIPSGSVGCITRVALTDFAFGEETGCPSISTTTSL